MFISSRGRYALRVMTELAENGDEGFTPMNQIAAKLGISLKYLEQILPVLTKNQLIEGISGKGGGYRLTRSPESYTVGEILRLTEGSLAPVTCLSANDHGCPNETHCKSYAVWAKLNDVINEYLDSVSLTDVIVGKVRN